MIYEPDVEVKNSPTLRGLLSGDVDALGGQLGVDPRRAVQPSARSPRCAARWRSHCKPDEQTRHLAMVCSSVQEVPGGCPPPTARVATKWRCWWPGCAPHADLPLTHSRAPCRARRRSRVDADFDWQSASRVAGNRFPQGTVGRDQWNDLVEQVAKSPDLEYLDELLRTFHQNLSHDVVPGPFECRVFVSHRAADAPLARTIAQIVANTGYGYWLDVEDPVLLWANNQPVQSPAYEILVAAIIEIALLNSSHVIAAMTPNSAGSKWIPYEYGRAKERLPASRNSAIYSCLGCESRTAAST
jgi:TIR domain